MADREADTRPFTPDQKDTLKMWAKDRESSKPKASGKSTDIRLSPLEEELNSGVALLP